MANPQKENGCTDIANELLEKIYSSDFTATQLEIILCVIRYTYGFHRKEHKLSVSFISKAINKSKRYITSEMQKLINKKVLIETSKPSFNSTREIGINKNYDNWCTREHLVKYSSPGELEFTKPGEVEFTPPGELEFTQETKKETKNKTKNTTACSAVTPNFDFFVEQVLDYMNQLGGTSFKETTRLTRDLIKKRLDEGFNVEDLKDVVYYKYHEWVEKPIKFGNGVSSAEYYKPSTLFGKKFEDYLQSYRRNYK